MKRGTESRVFLGKDTSIDEFTGINVFSTVLLGKKEGGFKDHNGLFIASNVTLGKGIARVITVVVYGTSPLSLPNAIEADVVSLKAFGGTEQETETIIQTATAQGKTEQRNLPDGYTQLEYIESTGTQYINTGVPVSDDLVFGYKAAPKVVNQISISQLLPSPTGRSGLIVWQSNGYINIRYLSDGSTFTTNANVRYVTNQVVDIIFNDNNKFYIDDSLAYTKTNTIDTSGVLVTGVDDRVYSLWAKIDGVLIFNGIPCRRNSDNVIGMYDTVSQTFFTNAGTGTFTAGSDAVPTPDTPMDIISNNGVLKARHQSGLPLGYTLLDSVIFDSTQVIDTGFIPDNNSRIESKCYRTGADCWFYGASPSNPRVTLYHSSTGTSRWGYQSRSNAGFVADTEYIIVEDKNGLNINGVDNPWTSGTADDFTCDRSLTIGNNNGSTGTRYFAGNFYYMKIWNNGVLARDFVPCQNASNVVGLYDRVNGVFYTDTGLVAGNPVSDPVEIYTDGTVETITDALSNTATAEMSLKVGDYQDEQEILSGVVTRNVGVLVLDGTESWQLATATDLVQFYTSRTQGVIANNVSLTSTIAPYGCTATNRTEYDFGCYSGGSGNLCFQMKGSATLTSVSAWTQYLAAQYAAGTPVIIVYPLATATTETVTGQNLRKEPLTVTGSLPNLLVNTTTGDAVPTPDYLLDIICNNGALKVSPNLFDKNNYEEIEGYVDTSTGELKVLSGSSNVQRCVVLNVKPNTTYSISGILNSGYGAFATKTTGSVATSYISGNGTLTTGPNDSYIIGLIRTTNGTYDYRDTLQIETGSTATPYMPYGQIYTDGTVETINVHGKNLFDISAATEGYYIAVDGTVTPTTSDGIISDYIPVNSSTEYTLSCLVGVPQNAIRIHNYDSSKTWISQASYGRAGGIGTAYTDTFTTASNAKYVRISINNGQTNIQLEQGSTATAYEPYYNGGTATAEMLLKIGNYQDVQSILDGVVTRKVGVKVFNGTENWVLGGDGTGVYVAFDTAGSFNIANAICQYFSYTTGGNINIVDMQQNSFCLYSNGNISFKASNTTSVKTWTSWLADQYAAGTPVIVVYQLTTPTAESVTGQPMSCAEGDNTAEITQASMDGLTLEVTYLAGATVTIQEVENAQLSDDVDVTIH